MIPASFSMKVLLGKCFYPVFYYIRVRLLFPAKLTVSLNVALQRCSVAVHFRANSPCLFLILVDRFRLFF